MPMSAHRTRHLAAALLVCVIGGVGCASQAPVHQETAPPEAVVSPNPVERETAQHGFDLTPAKEAEIRYALAEALVKEQALELAREHFDWLRHHRPAWWLAHLEYARTTYLTTSDSELAMRALQRAIVLKPFNPRAFLLRGQIAEDGSDLEAAEAAYRQVLTWRPEDIETRMRLARILARTNRLSEANEAYAYVISKEPEHIGALLGSAKTHERSGELIKAEALYRQVLKVHSDRTLAMQYLAHFFRRTNNAAGLKKIKSLKGSNVRARKRNRVR